MYQLSGAEWDPAKRAKHEQGIERERNVKSFTKTSRCKLCLNPYQFALFLLFLEKYTFSTQEWPEIYVKSEKQDKTVFGDIVVLGIVSQFCVDFFSHFVLSVSLVCSPLNGSFIFLEYIYIL